MKGVLIVHPYRHVGGPDTFVVNLAKSLTPRGWQVWVCLAEERPLAATLRGSGASVVVTNDLETLPRTLSPIRIASHLRCARAVASLLRDVVRRAGLGVVHGVHETMWSVLRPLRDLPVGRVVSVHGLRFASPAWAGRVNAQLLAASADRIICVSAVVRDLFRSWGIGERQLSLMPSSVDLERFSTGISGGAVRHELGIPDNALVVGTVGSVDERKGQTYFVEAFARLYARYPLLHGLVVGHTSTGPDAQASYLNALRERARGLGLDGRLQFVPARPDIPEVMAALDVLVQPSLSEAGPRAPLEAMAMARPVVGTRVGAIPEEVVDGETALLVPPADSATLAEAIGRLLDDPGLRSAFGRAGRARVERYYSLTATAETIDRIYSEAAERGSKVH
jgi:glycosyltransferase involved in cell wall biosynthesis